MDDEVEEEEVDEEGEEEVEEEVEEASGNETSRGERASDQVGWAGMQYSQLPPTEHSFLEEEEVWETRNIPMDTAGPFITQPRVHGPFHWKPSSP